MSTLLVRASEGRGRRGGQRRPRESQRPRPPASASPTLLSSPQPPTKGRVGPELGPLFRGPG
eukprot:8679739-Pyramimonas_sp.AAC.1